MLSESGNNDYNRTYCEEDDYSNQGVDIEEYSTEDLRQLLLGQLYTSHEVPKSNYSNGNLFNNNISPTSNDNCIPRNEQKPLFISKSKNDDLLDEGNLELDTITYKPLSTKSGLVQKLIELGTRPPYQI